MASAAPFRVKLGDEEAKHRPPGVLEQYTQQVARETVAYK